MSDIVERLRTHCIDLEGGIRDEEILAAADEITRLRSLLKEAGEALEPFGTFGAANVVYSEDWPVWHSNIHREAISYWFGPSDMMKATSVLSKIKGEA